MIAIIKQGTTQESLDYLLKTLEEKGVQTHVIVGEKQTIVGLIGDTTSIDPYRGEQCGRYVAQRTVICFEFQILPCCIYKDQRNGSGGMRSMR